jgi:acyl-CoA thioester hydrolase
LVYSSLSDQPLQTRLRVRYAETDQMGVVYHANYLIWMEVGRVELLRSRGFAYQTFEDEGLYLSVVEAKCRYLFPARYDQEIIVETTVKKSSLRGVEFAYRILSVEPERLLAEGFTKHLWLNHEMRPTRLPEQYRDSILLG